MESKEELVKKLLSDNTQWLRHPASIFLTGPDFAQKGEVAVRGVNGTFEDIAPAGTTPLCHLD